MASKPKLPPFARPLAGIAPKPGRSIWVYVGADAWAAGRAMSSKGYEAVTLPPGDDPAGYDWRFAAGWSIVVFDTGGADLDALRKLGVLLIKAGATLVTVVTTQPAARTGMIFRPAPARRAA